MKPDKLTVREIFERELLNLHGGQVRSGCV